MDVSPNDIILQRKERRGEVDRKRYRTSIESGKKDLPVKLEFVEYVRQSRRRRRKG